MSPPVNDVIGQTHYAYVNLVASFIEATMHFLFLTLGAILGSIVHIVRGAGTGQDMFGGGTPHDSPILFLFSFEIFHCSF